ncbi:MAG TPA: hypothetical protein VM122_05545 [Usitatibacter sp.]|nr:hypothetical protein [Usitatibacter sp.]
MALAATSALPATAARIVPADPVAFQPVNLRMTVDSCAFVPGTVRVSAVGTTLKVTQHLNNCLVAGTAEIVDVRLGTLAEGDYRVELYASPSTDVAPVETLSFRVHGRVEIAVFPPPVRPLTDYSGLWWNSSEGGWGLSLHQSPMDVLFGSWYVYGASGQPEWFTIQAGQWTSATRWAGTIYRNTGPFFAGPGYDPRLVLIQSSGTAVLEFKQLPGQEDRATFTYTIGNVTTTKGITRYAF